MQDVPSSISSSPTNSLGALPAMRCKIISSVVKFLWFSAIAVVSGGMSAHAASVTPIHLEMTSSGSGSRQQIVVTNDSKSPLPIEITVQGLDVDLNGQRKVTKGKDEFLVFPPNALVAPNGSQVFRIQWVGEPELPASQSYLLTVNQIPVKQPAGQSSVQVVMNFGVIINVAPPKGESALQLVGTGIERDKKTGKSHPAVTVNNPTKVHALLPNSTIRLSGAGWSHVFSPGEMREKVGIGLVQPGKKRKFILPVDLPANVTKVEATLDYKPKRN